jgi:hypothetical protein
MPKYAQHLVNFYPLNSVSLSMMTHLGKPNLKIIIHRNLTAFPCVMFTIGIASIHLVNVSIAINRNMNPPDALGKAPTISIP